MEPCPCQSGKDVSACCGPYLSGEKKAETAEILLRSRYAAYVRKNVDYIVETTHPDQREADARRTVERWMKSCDWKNIEIVECSGGGLEDLDGTVEFKAAYIQKGRRQLHHEVAEFKKADDVWYFHDAKAPQIAQYVRSEPKIGRNEPCSCGSGKKYKKCCGKDA